MIFFLNFQTFEIQTFQNFGINIFISSVEKSDKVDCYILWESSNGGDLKNNKICLSPNFKVQKGQVPVHVWHFARVFPSVFRFPLSGGLWDRSLNILRFDRWSTRLKGLIKFWFLRRKNFWEWKKFLRWKIFKGEKKFLRMKFKLTDRLSSSVCSILAFSGSSPPSSTHLSVFFIPIPISWEIASLVGWLPFKSWR